MARDTWYRLDNIGKFYSSEAGGHAQTVFRYSATLVDEVDPAILQSALTSTEMCIRDRATEAPAAARALAAAAPVTKLRRESSMVCARFLS